MIISYTSEERIIGLFQERTSLIQILGKNVRTERRKANLTMEKLAELSDVSLQTIKDIEHAKRACQVDTLVAIASALDLSPDYLLGFTKFNIENSQNKSDFEGRETAKTPYISAQVRIKYVPQACKNGLFSYLVICVRMTLQLHFSRPGTIWAPRAPFRTRRTHE